MTVVISALARKGGCGKSTALKLMASAMAHSGQKVSLIDTDPQGDLTRWWRRAEKYENTGDNVDFHVAPTSEEALYDLIDELDGKSDFILIDTKGEGAAWADAIATISDFIITPVMVSSADHALTLDLRDWFNDLMERVEPGSTVAKHFFLLSRVPKDLTRTGKMLLERIVEDFNLLDIVVRERGLVLDQDEYGLIGPQWVKVRESKNPLERGQAVHLETLLKIGYSITQALLTGRVIKKPQAAITPGPKRLENKPALTQEQPT